MSSGIIKQHYISLVKLLKIYQNQDIGQTHLKATQQFCKALLATAKTNPNLTFAQPQLYKSQLPYITNLAFNTCVNTCLFAARNKIDESVSIQLMSASLSLIASNQTSINEHDLNTDEKIQTAILFKVNNTLTKQLKAFNQYIWADVYSIHSNAHKVSLSALNKFTLLQSLAYLSIRLALICTPNKRIKALKFAQAFKQLCLVCPAHWYQNLSPLLRYPSLSPPGTVIKHHDGSILIILAISEHGLIVKPMMAKTKQDGENEQVEIRTQKGEATFKIIAVKRLTQCYASQAIKDLNKLKYWWNDEFEIYCAETHVEKTQSPKGIQKIVQRVEPFEKKLALQSAPPSLLVIQDQLTNINTDIAVITKAIEKEPAYIQQLQQSASIRNRQKQPVETIQHGLAMLGYERTSSLLLEHSLLLRLNQEYFPLQKQLLIFSGLYASIASEIANKNKSLSAETLSSTAYFVLSRLFTIPQLKTQLKWQTGTSKHFEIASLIQVKGKETLKDGAVVLAKAWQQNSQILDVLKYYDSADLIQNKKIVRQLAYVLGLSLIIAKDIYFQPQEKCNDTQNYIKSALAELGLQAQDLAIIGQHATNNSVTYSAVR